MAQLRARNTAWAEQAVTQGVSLSAQEALKMHVIDIIANDILDLLKQINGKNVIVQNRTYPLHTIGLQIHEVHPDWRTQFLNVITDPSVAYILLIIGFYGLLFEFLNPGFFLPGVSGAICLLLALYAFQLLPINYVGLALIVLGLSFIVAEAFAPSGALAVGGVISFIVGSVFLLKTGSGFCHPLAINYCSGNGNSNFSAHLFYK